MQGQSDYQRGLERGRADAKQGWARCWMPARQLAEEAVYSHLGLSPEQQGYADALDEAFPGGMSEITCFLDRIETLGQPLVLGAPETDAAPSSQPLDALAPVVREADPEEKNKQWEKKYVLRKDAKKSFYDSLKSAFLARFM